MSDLEALEVPQYEGAVADTARCGQHELVGGQLEVDGALGEDAVLEVEGPRVVGEDVREDPLHLRARRLGELTLAHESALGRTLARGLPGADLGVHVFELLGGDAAALDEDRAELVLGVVRRTEEDPAPTEIERLLVGGAIHLQGAGGSLPMEVHEEEGEGFRVDGTADGERVVGQEASRRPSSPPSAQGWIAF